MKASEVGLRFVGERCCTGVVVLWVCCVETSSGKGKRVRPLTLSDELKLVERFAGRKIGP